MCVYCSFTWHVFLAQQYYTEDDDYDDVDLINLFIAMALLGDDEDDDVAFPFYLSEEYDFWAFSVSSVPVTTGWGPNSSFAPPHPKNTWLCFDPAVSI